MIGLSIAIGMMLGAAGGGFVRARSLEWRATAAVDTLAPWRGRNGEAPPADPFADGAWLPTTSPAAPSNGSDYERGFAWARQAGVASAAECESYSWSYQRGCLAWLRDARPKDAYP